jgi:hypothetical protein
LALSDADRRAALAANARIRRARPGNTEIKRFNVQEKARRRASIRLAKLYPDLFRALYREELDKLKDELP